MADLADRLRAKVDSSGGEDACWPFMGARFPDGYGCIAVGGRAVGAHRVAFVEAGGAITTDRPHVLHACDNPPCCNPRHLFAGTHADNMRDAVAKGRHVSLAGEAHGRAKLTAADVAAIRASSESQRALAARFGVGKSQIARVKRGEQWREAVGA